MSNRTINLTEPLYDYLAGISLHEPETFARLRAKTAQLPDHNMQIAPDQGQFMALLARLIDAHNIIEIGTFTGYSTLWLASALPPTGRLIACDVSAERTDIAQRYWKECRLAERIDLRLAPALETLDFLIISGEAGSYDLIFIDADKTNYLNYYERALRLLRTGGLIIADNALWGGKVADPTILDDDTVAIRDFNQRACADPRVDVSLIPVGDGLLLARKRP